MKETTIITHRKIKMKNPVLIEGLPGIGLVGKIAADHLIKERKALKVATIYSPHFPHQVMMRKSGVIRMLRLKFYHGKAGKQDLLFLVGDVQPLTSEAHYELAGQILDYFKKCSGKHIITLGGYGTGHAPKEPQVFGACTHKHLLGVYQKHGIIFGKTRGAILGAAGLLLGLGRLKGMHGVCLMGETHGGYIDPKSALNVIKALGKILNAKFDTSELEKKMKEGEKYIKKMQERASKGAPPEGGEMLPPASKSDLSYIR